MRYLFIPLVALGLTVQAQQTSVLFIGNSYVYVNDLPNTFRQLALSLGDETTVASSAPGGYTLLQHASYVPTIDAIASQPWDFVVMQEQSQLGALPPDVTDTEIGAVQLVAAIEENYECTYPVFYMTWGRENGDDLNCPNFPFMCTYDGMQQGLHDNYIALAEYNDGYTAPVGWAWKTVRETHPEIDLYVDDGSHPTPSGTYLAACVFYSTLFNSTTVGASYLGGLDQATATILQTIASNTVLGTTTTWNMDVANGTDATIDGQSSTGPTDITYYHFGQGTHLWTCSNGQTSTDANPTFTFSAGGIYTFTHTYTDPCGNTDTVTWNVDVAPVGTLELEQALGYRVFSTGVGTLEIRGGKGGEQLRLTDLQGRLVTTHSVTADRMTVTLPSGVYIWTIRDQLGKVAKGRLVVA